MTSDAAQVLETVRAALRSTPHIDLRTHPIEMTYADGTLTLEGEVPNVAAKKLALEHAAALPEVSGILDRLRVRPAQPMGDREIRNHVRDALLQEPAFREFALRERTGSGCSVIRMPVQVRGEIEIDVQDGVVTLNGRVPGLDDKRLVGVLAWWVPGSRDVINGIAVDPPEEDSDDAIAEATRLALEKDPFVNAGQIRVGVRRAVVTLIGSVTNEYERDMAEFDAWYVFGVDRVINNIGVLPG